MILTAQVLPSRWLVPRIVVEPRWARCETAEWLECEEDEVNGSPRPVGGRPAVSVVMPVFNSGDTLAAAIESIREQTFTDWQLLVLDDGSSDQSLKIAASAASADDRIRSIPLNHTGLINTLNRGLELAAAELVARMDADDISLPLRLEKQVAFLSDHPHVAVLGGAAETFHSHGEIRQEIRHPTEPSEVAAAMEKNSSLVHPSVVMRRDVVLSLGGYRAPFPAAEDYDLWLRVMEQHQIANLPDVILRYRIGGSQESVLRAEQQIISGLAARLCHRERMAGRPDPLEGSASPITREGLTSYGMDDRKIDDVLLAEMTHRSWWLAKIGLFAEAEMIGRGILEVSVLPSNSRNRRFLSLWSRFRVAMLAGEHHRAVGLLVQAACVQPWNVLRRGISILSRVKR